MSPTFHPLASSTDINFAEVLRFLGRSNKECLFQVSKNEVEKLYWLEQEVYVVKVQQKGDHIGYLCIPEPDERGHQMIRQDLEEWLDLHRDLTPFYRMCHGDPILNHLAIKFEGLRLIGINDLFEALAWSIIGQQINLQFAYQMKRALVTRYGISHNGSDQELFLFPAPERIAQLDIETLKQLQFSRQKAEYLIGIATIFAEGALSKQQLMSLPPSAGRDRLLEIRGVGAWTADYVRLKCLKQVDAIPYGDAGLINAIRQLGGLNEKPSLAKIQEISENWAPWRCYATFYLWHGLLDPS